MSLMDRIVAGESRQRPLLRRLREAGKPVLIYGAGVYAYVLNRYLADSGIKVAAVMVDAAYKSDPTFMGLEVVATEDTLDRIAEYQVVIRPPSKNSSGWGSDMRTSSTFRTF